jgi:type IV pilus assembly protein PilQ
LRILLSPLSPALAGGAPDLQRAPSADIESYTIEDPARIVLDFPDTRSGLDQKRYAVSQANATSVMVLESGDRTRMIVNLVDLVPFESSVSGRHPDAAGGPR